MGKYSYKSYIELSSAHLDLQKIFKEVLELKNHSIIEGFRNEKKQNSYFEKGLSALKYPNSNHNQRPSLAVDAVPYPEGYMNIRALEDFALIVKSVAHILLKRKEISHSIKWGGDWEEKDYAHWELKKIKEEELHEMDT